MHFSIHSLISAATWLRAFGCRYVSPQGPCAMCSPVCENCSTSADSCTTCPLNSYLNVNTSSGATTCRSTCPNGSYPDVATRTCKPCNPLVSVSAHSNHRLSLSCQMLICFLLHQASPCITLMCSCRIVCAVLWPQQHTVLRMHRLCFQVWYKHMCCLY